MSTRARTWAAGIAVVLFGLMLFLLLHGPRLTFQDDEADVRVVCASVLIVGWPTDGNFLADESSSAWSDHTVGAGITGDAGNLGRQSIANGCSDARTTYLGFLVLLAIPTTVLATAAVVGRSREPAYRRL